MNKNILNSVLLSEKMTLNYSEISTYKQNALLIEERSKFSLCIDDNYSKIQKQSFLKNFYSKNCRVLNFFRYIVRVFLEGK